MTSLRISLRLSASLLLPLVAPAAAFAADAAPSSGDDNQIVVTGTRAQGRTKLDSIAPIDVLTAEALQHQGTPELGTALANVAPSIDFPRPSATDGTDSIRPATLRGMSPDQTLVLINGIRAHTSAYLNVNGSVGRGSAAVDLNTIPTVALETVEVLRDGASAQYGSDALAGVINLRLRQADHGGGATASYGFYDTNFNTAHTSRSVTGEPVINASVWQGMKLGQDGFLTLSGDFQHRSATNRSDIDTRTTPNSLDSRYGDPEVYQYTGFANFGKGLGGSWQLYGYVGYQSRRSQSAALPRLATAAATYGLAEVYPDGFLPMITMHSKDLSSALGVKGEYKGWDVNLHASYGRNKIRLFTNDSANYTYGAESPTNFYDGSYTYEQLGAGLDASKQFNVFKSLNVAWGVEGRKENYRSGAGEFASYGAGSAYPTATYGAQGYVGIQPGATVDESRNNVAGYVDAEAQITDKFRLGLAGRGEGYSDFGAVGTGKVSMRYDFSPAFAIRATGSTGFRAPSLQQEYYTSVSSLISNGVVSQTGTYPSSGAIAESMGGKPLKPERSASASAGFVARFAGIDLTVDGYYTHVRNAIVLSESQTVTNSALLAAGITKALFFLNGPGETFRGIDAVAHYKLRTPNAGTFDFTVAGNVNKIGLNTDLSTTLFSQTRRDTIMRGTPGEKVTATADWARGDLGATARFTYYGNVYADYYSTGQGVYSTGPRGITDLELRYQPKESAFNLAIGANNLFDVYPRATPIAYVGGSYGAAGFPGSSPFGFNGRYLYVRAGVKW